jgi:nucleoside-diphosphate-sugar epimerase
MNIRTVAVFGAGGKLGRRVLGVLKERGMKVRALVHRTPLPDDPNVEQVHGSIADACAVEMTIVGTDAVVHLATTKEDPRTFFDVSIRGTWNVLEGCRKTDVKQLILFGGDAAFGIWFYPQPMPIDENHPLTAYPGNYAFSKVIEETMAQQYAIQYKMPVTILRSSWVFQDDDLLRHFSLLENVNPAEPGHGFGKVADDVMALVRAKEERIPILTDRSGKPLKRHIVHIDDVMNGFDKMLGNDKAIGESFNIAGPAAFEYRDAAEYLWKTMRVPTVELRTPYFPFEIDITKAKRVLGYSPENDFARIADRAIEHRRIRHA